MRMYQWLLSEDIKQHVHALRYQLYSMWWWYWRLLLLCVNLYFIKWSLQLSFDSSLRQQLMCNDDCLREWLLQSRQQCLHFGTISMHYCCKSNGPLLDLQRYFFVWYILKYMQLSFEPIQKRTECLPNMPYKLHCLWFHRSLYLVRINLHSSRFLVRM